MTTADAQIVQKAVLDSINRLADDMREMRTDTKKELGELRQISERLVRIETRLQDVDDIEAKYLAQQAEIALLKADLNKRDGERGMLNIIMKSPLSYVIAGGAALIAWVKGAL